MRAWNFKVKKNLTEVSNKLESALGSLNGFVFDMDDYTPNSITFKMRKRIMYAWYLAYHNWTIVNGKLLKTGTDNETTVEISFTQHFLITLIIFTHMFLGLGFIIAIISGMSSSASMYILGGILLAVGIVLWVAIQKKFEKDIQSYRTLISEVLES